MDETLIKAERHQKERMRQGYLWSLHDGQDEIVFSYTSICNHHRVKGIIGDNCSGTLLTEGYDEAYVRYAHVRDGVTRAQCWSHTRRCFERAQEAEPESVEDALALTCALFHHEKEIRKNFVGRQRKLSHRTQYCEPAILDLARSTMSPHRTIAKPPPCQRP